MIKAVISIYIVVLVIISVGWLSAEQGLSLPLAMIFGIGLTSVVMVFGGALYTAITSRSSDTTEISDIND